jgi:hypothetical protein
MEFVGHKSVKHQNVKYFSVRAGGHHAVSISETCPLVFHWNNKAYKVNALTISQLAESGVQVDSAGNNGLDDVTAFIDDGEDHQKYGVEFYFKNGRIYHFYAWYNVDSLEACPFQISSFGHDAVAFPVDSKDMKRIFGEPDSVAEVLGK